MTEKSLGQIAHEAKCKALSRETFWDEMNSTNSLAVAGPVERPVRPCLVVYGDGMNDDSDALQDFLDVRADLIHADGSSYSWPGTTGRKYALAKTLILGGGNRNMKTTRETHQLVRRLDDMAAGWLRAGCSPPCCAGGPQWGHAWNCNKCPD